MGIWANRSDDELQTTYKTAVASLGSRHGLAAPATSHYSGAFGFQSMVITTKTIAMQPDPKITESVRAHEAFHAFQAMVFQSVRETFRSIQAISRRQLLTLAQLVNDGQKISIGENILDAGKKSSAPQFKRPYKSLESSISTLEKGLETVKGVTIFDLIEGSAAAVEVLNRYGNFNPLAHLSLMTVMDTLKGIYGNAWRLYRGRGGESAAVFALLCSSSLRYGSVSPPNFDSAPSPQEVFEYLTRFSKHFDSYINTQEHSTPDFSAEMPLGEFRDPDFNPRKAELPEEDWADYPQSESKEHHFPDEMFEPRVESALESYKAHRTQDQICLQDNLFGVSMAIADAMDAAYIRVGPSVTKDQVAGEGRMIYDHVACRVETSLPGLRIEEVLLLAIVQPEFQSRLASVFEDEVRKLRITPWHDSPEVVEHGRLVALFDLVQKIDSISVAEHDSRVADDETWAAQMPICCDYHKGDARTLTELIACDREDSLASTFMVQFGQPFSSIWSRQ